MVGHRQSLFSVFTAMLLFAATFLPAANGEVNDPQWCGNKHKNLVRLQAIVGGTPGVEVPEFIGIPTGRIEQFLQQHSPEIFRDYRYIVSQLNQKSKPLPIRLMGAAFTRFMGGRNRPLDKALATIQEKIKACFSSYLFNFTPQEQQLFARIQAQGRFFMVRSTGVEDSQTVANAGGNVSVAYVEPDRVELQKAMGEVIASYFGMQSLKNRIAGGETLSATDLCLPVLIQVLIGETLEGAQEIAEIPVSGVAFTTNQGLSAPNFSVTEINAAYGHGEGVVANRVTADRYCVTNSRALADVSIYPMLSQKSDRLVPHFDAQKKQHTLIECKNSDDLAHRSALSQSQVKQLYTVLKKIESDYGQPMDVEFVVLGTTIYVVQARPAMRHTSNPSYCALENIAEGDRSEFIQGITLVTGSAQVITITNPSDIIIAKTLDEADQHLNSGSCKAVIVGQWASSLSHAAVNFISHGTPCIYVQDINAVKKLLQNSSSQQPLVIDPQRRLLFLWKNINKNISTIIQKGWFEHPIDRTLSLYMDKMPVLVPHSNPIPQDAKLVLLLENFKKANNQQQKKDLLVQIVERITNRLSLTERRIYHAGILCDETFKKSFTTFKTSLENLMRELTIGSRTKC